MDPRALYRTHYQVDEPAFVEVIVARCTSPVRSAYDEVVAERLTREIRNRGKDFNKAAAGYALDLARGLAVLGPNNIWDDNGHLVNLTAVLQGGQWLEELSLTEMERFLYFKLFLEADGAVVLELCRLFLAQRQLPRPSWDWNAIARNLYISIYDEYLTLTNAAPERIALRNRLDALRKRGFDGKTGAHKVFVHLQTLHRLGLIERVESSNDRQYVATDQSQTRIQKLLSIVPNVLVLEDVVRWHRCIDIAASVYDFDDRHIELTPWEALGWLLPNYRQIVETGVAICPIAPLLEATQIALLTQNSCYVSYSELLDLLRQLQAENMRDVRFHQDRRGNPAFLRLSGHLVG